MLDRIEDAVWILIRVAMVVLGVTGSVLMILLPVVVIMRLAGCIGTP